MDREGFRNRFKQYKKAREENPGLKYWEWKNIPKYGEGTDGVDDDLNASGIKTVFTTDGADWRKRPTQEQLDAFYSGNVKRQIQLAEQAGQTATYTNPKYALDEVVVAAKDLKKEQQRNQEYNNILDLGITAAGFVPGLGEVADAVDVANQLRQGNYGEALISTAAFLLPGISANLLQKGVKGIKSMLYNTGRFFQPAAYDKLLELYKNTPILNQKGTFEDYLNYAKTIFPESAIYDIHYHGGAKGITKFKDTGEEITTVNPGAKNGIYFSPHKKYSENIRKDRARLLNADGTYRPILKSIGLNLMRNKLNKKVLDETELYTVLLNSKKPLYTTGTWTWAIDDKLGKKIKTDGYDAIVNAGTNQRISKMPETIVFDPNNIHILGNESDALNFQKYLDNHNRPQNGYGLRYNPITQTYEKVLELINQTPYYSAMSPEQHFRSTLIDSTNRHKDIWGYKQFSHAVDQGYRKNDTPIIKEFTWPNDAKVAPTIDAKGNIWFNIGEQSKLTNEIVEDNVAKGFDVTKINNVDELGYPSDIAIVHPFVPIDEKVYGVSKKFKYAEGGEVTGPPTYEQWYTDITKYNPTILDNASMYWSIEQAKKDLHAQAMGLPGYAPMWNEYMRTLPKDDPDINEFVDQLWEYENPDNVGYNSAKKKYYPHKSPEGGKMTIGPGFKLGSGSHNITEREAKRGVTKARLNQEARRSGNNYFKAVDKALNKGQTANPADTVSKQMKYGLADILHQTGSLDNWPKLLNAVRNGDLENIKKESIVTWKDSSGKVHEDVRRNNLRNENNWHY